MSFFELGRVARLQIAPEVPKVPRDGGTFYDPAPLLQVQQLVLDARGVSGVDANGQIVLDVHHLDHARSRFRGDNALSVGFTSHYDLMRQIFGAHVIDGCAAENILIQSERTFSIEDGPARIVIESASGERLDLGEAIVAEPCAPFARWALRDEDAEPAALREALQSLRRGTRGFYLGTQTLAAPFRVGVGDLVLAQRDP